MLIKNLKDAGNKVASHLDGEYSFIATILRGGTGSVRIIYVQGIEEFDDVASLDSTLPFCNIQIYKAGFAIRLIKKGKGQILAARFSELKRLIFLTTPIRTRIRKRVVIRHKANLIMDCSDLQIVLEVQQVRYKSFKKYVAENFNKDIIDWKLRPIEDDGGGNILDLISTFVN